MTPERYRQIGDLYHAALELEQGERAAFLDRECGSDPSLKSEVESLIASHEQASTFIAAPALAVAAEMLAETQVDALIGQTVARYRIVSLLGAGGMGRVYLAEDSALGRRVALKFLPEYFTNDKNQVQRFRQEARAASALNHPNILTVHEIGQANGTEFIATEFVEGETLRARLTNGPLRIDEAFKVAIQVADALAAAHEAGIVHRDIKPENIMIRRDGYVKVLDFGLAKLTDNLAEAKTVAFGNSAQSIILTNPGVVMGTAEYMSPEQARGLVVDARTDVWSLGVLLYEMLAGRRPFAGPTHSDTIVSILEKQPTSLLEDLQAPDELDRIVMKALEKDRDVRYQSIPKLAEDLRQLKRQIEGGPALGKPAKVTNELSAGLDDSQRTRASDSTATVPSNGSETLRSMWSVEYVVTEIKRHKIRAALFTSVLAVLLGFLGYGLYRFLDRAKPTVPFQASNIKRLTSSGKAKLTAISPDGKFIAYSETNKNQHGLWVKQVETGSAVQIVDPGSLSYFGLTISNDSNYVYYVRDERSIGSQNNLYKVPSFGGKSQKLLEQVDSAVTFSPDGTRLVFVRDNLKKEETEVVLANSDGSGQQTLAKRKAPDRFTSDLSTRVAWSPDGNAVACAIEGIDADGPYGGVTEISVDNGSEKLLTAQKWDHISQVSWLSDGKDLVMVATPRGDSGTANQLWKLMRPGGEAHRITNDLHRYSDVTLTANSTALATVQGNRTASIWVAPAADVSQARQITSDTFNTTLSWTRSGQVLYWSNASGKGNAWMIDADGSNQKQLTFEGQVSRPSMSSDGRYVVYSSPRAGKVNIRRMDPDGSNAKQLTDGKANSNPTLSPDGKWVVYVSRDHGNGTLWKISIDGGEAVKLSEPTTNLPIVSPDGKYVACYYWDEQATPTRGVMILPFSGGPPLKRFNVGTDVNSFVLHWSLDGRYLLYLDGNTNIWGQPVDGAAPVQLTNFQGDQLFDFDYSPDSKWLAISRGRVTDDVVLISDFQ